MSDRARVRFTFKDASIVDGYIEIVCYRGEEQARALAAALLAGDFDLTLVKESETAVSLTASGASS